MSWDTVIVRALSWPANETSWGERERISERIAAKAPRRAVLLYLDKIGLCCLGVFARIRGKHETDMLSTGIVNDDRRWHWSHQDRRKIDSCELDEQLRLDTFGREIDKKFFRA